MNQPTLLEIACLASGRTLVQTTWQIEPLHVLAMSAATFRLYRVSGQGYAETVAAPLQSVEWSVVLKILKAPTGQTATKEQLGYWRREQLVYQAGILEKLPWQLTTPRCFANTEDNSTFCELFGLDPLLFADTCWLWLEDLVETNGREWSSDLYAQVARSLGHFNGAFLAGVCPLPDYDWLCRTFMRDYVRIYGGNLRRLLAAQSWEQPTLNKLFGQKFTLELAKLETEREKLLDILEQLPQTLAHCDMHRDNFIAYYCKNGKDGSSQLKISAIDWADLGLTPPGQELATLLGLSLGAYKDLQTDPFSLEEIVYPEYLVGLREAGWRGEEKQIRLAFSAAIAVRWGHALARNVGWYVLDGRQAWLEKCYGCPIEECLEKWAQVGRYVLERASEVRQLRSN